MCAGRNLVPGVNRPLCETPLSIFQIDSTVEIRGNSMWALGMRLRGPRFVDEEARLTVLEIVGEFRLCKTQRQLFAMTTTVYIYRT